MTTADYRQLMAQSPASVPGRNGKYNAKKCEYKGIIFDSLGEMKRYKELEVLVRVGEIFDLQRQITHSIVVNDVLICKYKSDFDPPFLEVFPPVSKIDTPFTASIRFRFILYSGVLNPLKSSTTRSPDFVEYSKSDLYLQIRTSFTTMLWVI